ncbi:hypothetical protein SKAU_G00034450 [Synaphobranchus kaupii]|uniref:SAM-dependent MTase RsmB/NOP-type domain-containing protein n=1 Tax=Synaphobranchus kaupii TaxID=118154 RepID=A0A9Q1GGJ8_SYNKA|nr:hypothetical protein SKAU_G00034450 [Synaphobranchus kaupii]
MQACQTKQLMIERPKDLVGPKLNDEGFADHIYVQAAAIFQNSHMEKPADQRLVDYGKKGNLWMPEGRDAESCLLAYELAFSSLKYQDIFESVIASCMFICYSVPEDLMSLVVVMLFDFQDRKFVKRRRLEREKLPDVVAVEACLFRYKTKLAASLARIRIKCNLVNIECALPEVVKERQKKARSLLLHAWVNTQKTSLEGVKDALASDGFSEVESVLQLQEPAFCLDTHCEDLLVFAAHHKEQLSETELVKDCKLVIEDKSCSLPVSAVRSVLSQDRCVLMAGSFSTLTVAHVAATAASRSGNVLVCESKEARRKELRDFLSKAACTNVAVIPRHFLDLDPKGVELEGVNVILMMPQCSLSAVSNPVEFIVRENRDIDLLQDLSRGSISQGRLNNLVASQKQEIEHALKVPEPVAVVYSTWSSYSEENEEVVQVVMRSKPRIYRLSATGLPPGSKDKPGDNKDLFLLEASAESNGGFVSVMTRVRAPITEKLAEAGPGAVKKNKCTDVNTEELTTSPEVPQTPTPAARSDKALSKKPAGRRKRKKL